MTISAVPVVDASKTSPGISDCNSLRALGLSDIVEFVLAILQQVVPQRRETDGADGSDAEHRKTDHNQQLGGYSQIAEHWAPYRFDAARLSEWRLEPC